VQGAAVTEVAHMLAELVENGLSFSSPDVEVEIYGRKTGGRYLLAVVDYGIGMPKEELEKAKARLRDEENFLVAPTRFLGHYVVGRLARQMAVQVDLGESPVSGITARMLLPAEIMAERPESPSDGKGGRSRPSGPRTPAAAPARSIAASQPPPTPEPARGGPPTVRMEPVANTGPTFTAPRMEPVAPPPSAPAMHRWPTDDESVGVAETSEPVTVAALANTEPYDPAQANTNHHPTPATAATTAERTRNGLVKRQPRHRGVTATRPAPTAPSAPRHTAGEGSTERTPTDVGTMLSAFRRGHQRGELNGRHANGDEPAPSHVVQEEPGDH
jgi:anti-sigma regulatory factor (Ser/Thr protein kinase)